MNWLQHFRKEEHPFIERALDWLDAVERRHATKRTDFLDPRQMYILRTLLPKFDDVTITESGGFPEAERRRALIRQKYYEPEENEIGLAAFRITSDQSAFQKLRHQDVLGSLIGAGLKRDKFGDIHLLPNEAQIVVAEEIADYLQFQLTRVHRVSVTLERIALSDLTPPREEWKTLSITVASMRIDAVAAEVFRLSRSKAASLIRSGLLKVNWTLVDSPSFAVRAGDIVSLRGYGRFQARKEEGTTRKGNIRLEVGVLP